MKRKIRARAPLRLGLAGGGTDLSPYCDRFGGSVLNCTISMYAYAFIEERTDWKARFLAEDVKEADEVVPHPLLDPTEGLRLHRGVYNRIVSEYNGGRPLAVDVFTSVDAPPGSGLGSSSALVVALVKAYAELLDLPMGDYDVARLAYRIEREDLGMAGGRQDQYAAAFGGCNFMEFLGPETVVVNPLRIHDRHRLELESSLVVCHTGRSRVSSTIIEQQKSRLAENDEAALAAMHQIKSDAVDMKTYLLTGNIRGMADVLERSWRSKKNTAHDVSNERIDSIYETALASGALAGKISGAGGGGFLMFLTPPEQRQALIDSLSKQGLDVLRCYLTSDGSESWSVQ